MARSVAASFADWMRRRPEWAEQDGDRMVSVRGFSPLDNLIYGVIGATMILGAAACLLAVMP